MLWLVVITTHHSIHLLTNSTIIASPRSNFVLVSKKIVWWWNKYLLNYFVAHVVVYHITTVYPQYTITISLACLSCWSLQVRSNSLLQVLPAIKFTGTFVLPKGPSVFTYLISLCVNVLAYIRSWQIVCMSSNKSIVYFGCCRNLGLEKTWVYGNGTNAGSFHYPCPVFTF